MPELKNQEQNKTIINTQMFQGYNLSYINISSDNLIYKDPDDKTLSITYCISGRVCWKSEGHSSYLNHGDLLIHRAGNHDKDYIELPNGYFEGIQIQINLDRFFDNLPDVLTDSGISADLLKSKYFIDECSQIIPSSSIINSLFEGLCLTNTEDKLKYSLAKLKSLELLVYISEYQKPLLEEAKDESYSEIIHKIHNLLIDNLDQRYTIDDLSKQFHINPTTLKNEFKEIYGTSIAAHIKEHRMELAAELITSSNYSISEIAKKCGYESQGKLTAAFKEFYGMLPSEYRKNRT